MNHSMNLSLSSRISSTAPYAFAEVDRQVAKLKQEGVEVIDFGVGDPKTPAPDFVFDALAEGARQHAASGYPSYVGSADYRRACANYMQRTFNVTLDPDTEILASIGSKESVFTFPMGVVDPVDLVICPPLGYSP